MTRLYQNSASGLGDRCEQTVIAFDAVGGPGPVGTVTLFTVTGAVRVRLVCICTESLVEGVGGGTIEVGIAGATASFIAQATSTDLDTGDVWHDATPDAASELWSVTSVTAEKILGNGQDIIATIGTRNITDGTLVFSAFWTPLTSTGLVVAA